MSVEFIVSDIIPATPETIFKAWLDSKEHSKMTGSPAEVSKQVGGSFSAWDGYIQGKNRELTPSSRILQAWRTTEFDETDQDSDLEILLEDLDNNTKVTIKHSNLPSHGLQYQEGWKEAYFNPMKEFFG